MIFGSLGWNSRVVWSLSHFQGLLDRLSVSLISQLLLLLHELSFLLPLLLLFFNLQLPLGCLLGPLSRFNRLLLLSFLLKPELTFFFTRAAGLRGSLGLAVLALVVFLEETFFDVAEMVVLETCQLNQLLCPDGVDSSELAASRGDAASY